MSLFELEPILEQAEVVVLSAGAKLTLRNNRSLADGIHPATRQPLNEDTTLRCGNCAHVVRERMGKIYWKCRKHLRGMTHGPASDIRVSWPACALHSTEITNTQGAPTNG